MARVGPAFQPVSDRLESLSRTCRGIGSWNFSPQRVPTVPELTVIATTRPAPQRRLPPWLKRPLPAGPTFARTRQVVADSRVATVCQEAKCPNLAECWSAGTATFMILGDRCTRRCHYCAVSTARPHPPEPDEPARLAEATARLRLRHVVITAVARDDLPDDGAGHFAECVRCIRQASPEATIEVLPADFGGRAECVRTLVDARPDVYNHNIEVVERLTPVVRPQGKYARSLRVLELVKQLAPDMPTKSGLMIGLGETEDEILETFEDLCGVGCDILTVGQYLQPGPNRAAVARFYSPAEFRKFARTARAMGFAGVACGPFVRSSYNAAGVFERTGRPHDERNAHGAGVAGSGDATCERVARMLDAPLAGASRRVYPGALSHAANRRRPSHTTAGVNPAARPTEKVELRARPALGKRQTGVSFSCSPFSILRSPFPTDG